MAREGILPNVISLRGRIITVDEVTVSRYNETDEAAASAASLFSGGSVTNAASASIAGADGIAMGGFSTASAETMVNDGRIEGTSAYGYGVDLSPGGSVTNAASASITGVRGVEISGGAGTVANYGSIAGTGTSGIGIYLRAGGLVTNATSALITGIAEGVFINGGAGTVANDGSIAGTGTNGRGVELFSGGSVTNTALASIAGTRYGVIVAGGVGVVINSGSIAATAAYGNAFSGTQVAGVELRSGGTVGNAASASITGGYDGISVIGGAGTVSITAASGAVPPGTACF